MKNTFSKSAHKEGDQREDGKYFWRFSKTKNKEIWITKEQLDKWRATRKAYRKMCAEEYRRREAQKAPEDQNYLGKYDFAKNRYFAGVSASGKELWWSKDKYLRLRELRNRSKKAFVEKMKKLPNTGVKIGDVHPDNPELFCVFKIGNKPFYGDAAKLQEGRESRARTYRKRTIKNKKRKAQAMLYVTNKYKRGDKHPENGTLFWGYNSVGKEQWLPKDVFVVKRAKESARRQGLRKRKKMLQAQQADQRQVCQEVHASSETVG